jgi:phospholipid/cholesterol/gamma-HCH transport system permease protein
VSGAPHRPLAVDDASLPRRFLVATGDRVLRTPVAIVRGAAVAVAVLHQALRPVSWRRTVRAELLRQCLHTGVGGLAATAIAALLIGLAMVSQALYWLELAGQPELVGQILVLVLVREIAPLVVAFIVIGRTGSVMVIELGRMEAGGQLRALDAQGVDPLLYLILPRVLAMAVSTFCLTVAFLAVAFVAGNLGSLIAGFSDMGPTELADLVLGAMGPAEFALVAIKSLGIGFLVGLVVCLGGLAPAPGVLGPERKLPRVFVLAVLTTFLVSAMVSAVL